MNEGENSSPNGDRPHNVFHGSRRYHVPSDEERYNAATNLSSNPSTPEFFSNAVMANTVAPQPKRSRRGLIIAIIIALFVVVLVAIISVILINKTKPTGDDSGTGEVSGELKEEYTRYLNIISANKDTSEVLDYESIREEQGDLFFELAINGYVEDLNRNEYLETLNTHFKKIEPLYNQVFDDNNMYIIQYIHTANIINIIIIIYKRIFILHKNSI